MGACAIFIEAGGDPGVRIEIGVAGIARAFTASINAPAQPIAQRSFSMVYGVARDRFLPPGPARGKELARSPAASISLSAHSPAI
jgi:hypothetical protein